MIPREILKKIRQIELRTNRIVTESVFWPALTCVLSPQERISTSRVFGLFASSLDQSNRRFFQSCGERFPFSLGRRPG